MQICASTCNKGSDVAAQGVFGYQPIKSAWAAQRWIRENGAVLTKFNVYR